MNGKDQVRDGARGGDRTRTALRPERFKPSASASSATRAGGHAGYGLRDSAAASIAAGAGPIRSNPPGQSLTTEFPTVFVADVSVDLRGIFAGGDTVVVEETMHATLAHGGHYENDYAGWFAAPRPAP